MRRVFLLVMATILVLIGVNFVLRYVHIRGVKDTIKVVSDKLSENGLKLNYKEIRYDSFVFWKVYGRIVNPVLLQERQGYSDESSFEYIDFSSVLINKKLSMNLSSKINTLINDSEGKHQYISTFSTNPQVDIKFNGYFMTNNKFLRTNELREYFIKHIDYLHYCSSGHKTIKVNKNINSDELLYTIGNCDIKIKNQNTKKYDDCEIKIQANEVKYNETSFGEGYFGLLAEVGESNYSLNANLLFNFKDESKIALNNTIMLDDIKPTHKLKIRSLKLSTEPYSLEISGNAVVSKIRILPYFDMNLNVVNFGSMLDFYSKFYNTLVPKVGTMKALSLRAITEKQKEAVFSLFKKIAKKSRDDSYQVNISNLKNAPIKVGEYPLDKVIEMYNDLVGQKQRY